MILIIEDDILIGEHLSTILVKEGFTPCHVVNSFNDAVVTLNSEEVELVLLDINLGGDRSGFDISILLNDMKIPFIYISAQSDRMSQERIIESKPSGFILKPFKPVQVTTAVKLFFKHVETRLLRLDDGKNKHMLDFQRIKYIQANRNYVEIIYDSQRLVVRKTLKEIEQLLPQDTFYKSHRSFVVNRKHIQIIHQKHLVIYEKEIPISQKYRDRFDEI